MYKQLDIKCYYVRYYDDYVGHQEREFIKDFETLGKIYNTYMLIHTANGAFRNSLQTGFFENVIFLFTCGRAKTEVFEKTMTLT